MAHAHNSRENKCVTEWRAKTRECIVGAAKTLIIFYNNCVAFSRTARAKIRYRFSMRRACKNGQLIAHSVKTAVA